MENVLPFRSMKLRSNVSTRANSMGSPYKKSEKSSDNLRGPQSLNDCGQEPALRRNGDLGLGGTSQVRSPKFEELKSPQVLTIGRESIAQWKENARKKRDWRIDRYIDPLQKEDCLRRNFQWGQKHIKEHMQVLITSNLNSQDSTIYTAIRAVSLPRSMLKGLECRTTMAHLKSLVRARINIERKAEGYHKYRGFGCSQLPRREKRRNRNKMKDLYDTSESGEYEVSDVDLEYDHASVKAISSDDYWYATKNDSCETVGKTSQQDTDGQVLTVPYESHVGAIIGNRYVLRGLVDTKPCYEIYDVHDAFSLGDDMYLIAKAYSIRGTKGRERDARVKNLKRNTAKPTRVDMIDQNGKKWLFFPNSSCSIIASNTQAVPGYWLGEKEYHLHFPSLSSCNRILSAPEGRYPKSYASCLQSGQVETENRFNSKNRRARIRQRRKRKEDRLAKELTMLGNTKVKESTLDKNCSLAEDSNPISTHRKSLNLDNDIQIVQPRNNVKVQERGSKTSESPSLPSESIPGLGNLNAVPSSRIEPKDDIPTPTSPVWREIPPQQKGKGGEQCHCFQPTFSNPREQGDRSNAAAVERYLQALDTKTGYGRFHDIDEHIWQRFTSGPPAGLKNRFFEVLEELRMNFEVEKDTIRFELAQSKRQRMIDLLRISYSPVIRYRTSQPDNLPQKHSEEEYAAFEEYTFSIYGNENASRALQFLHEMFDNLSYSEREELEILGIGKA